MGKVMQPDGSIVNVPNHVPKENTEHKVAESKSDPASAPPGELEKPTEKTEKAVAAEAKAEIAEEGIEEGDKEFPERVRKRIAAKHRAMKEAQEAADEAERFAETQYNERVLALKRAEAAERERDELKAQTPPKAPDELKEPDERDPQFFENGQFDWKKFAKALSQYETRKALAEAEESRKQEQMASERAQKEAQIRASTAKARELYPDFDQVMSSVSGTAADQVPQYVLNYLGETENAGLLAYHLAKNPEDALRIAKLKPILGLAELGKLEDKLTTKAPPKVEEKVPVVTQRGGAPAPIVPLDSGSASVNTDPAKMSYKELRAYERARRK